MIQVELPVQKRDTGGKEAVRKVRKEGNIPGILYGHKKTPMPIMINYKAFQKTFARETSLTSLFRFNCDNNTELNGKMALFKDCEKDPLYDTVMHVDFLEVSLEDEITVNVPIILRGEAIGQKEGGIVQQVRNDLKVRCLVKNIPEKIEYNIEKLDIGDSLHIRDLNLSGDIIALDNADYTIASVVTIKEEVVAPTITLETAALEPGVAGAEGAPGVETKAGEEDKKESKAKKEAKEEKKDKKEK
jgi:large subunit ribosomal protein L25